VISAMTSTEGFQTRLEGLLRVLENEHLRVVIAPQSGGKLISLFSRRTNTEWLLPPLRPYAEARSDAGFENWDGGGFDECLPTVAPSGSSPDHGELWRQPWQEEDPVTLRGTACGGALTVRRRALLDGSSLLLHYQVENVGQSAQSLLYSAHPLLRVQQGDRIRLPDEVRSLRVEGSRKNRLGIRGDSIAWPAAKGEDLSILGPPDGTQADKLFTGILSEGSCAVFRPSLQEGIKLLFDVQTLPYVGLWICRAAWPESGEAKQYTVALEPTSAPADALADAEREGTAWRLEPGQERRWVLRFALIHESPAEQSPTAESLGERLGRAHDRD
jgi:galactose mutarotase-like enzyme